LIDRQNFYLLNHPDYIKEVLITQDRLFMKNAAPAHAAASCIAILAGGWAPQTRPSALAAEAGLNFWAACINLRL
jgi:hypothetical protein